MCELLFSFGKLLALVVVLYDLPWKRKSAGVYGTVLAMLIRNRALGQPTLFPLSAKPSNVDFSVFSY
jgi:hypothetical protein